MERHTQRWFRVGAWILLITAALHTLGHVSGPAPARNDTEATLLRLMHEHRFELAGVQRSAQNFLDGFSLTFSVFLLFVGLLDLLLARHLETALLRRLALLHAGLAAAMLALSVIYFIPPPAVCFGLALVAFGAAAWPGPLRLRQPGGQ
jgi:hypothetical protein